MPNNSRVLTCGIDSMATDSIDSFLGEYWLFCHLILEEVIPTAFRMIILKLFWIYQLNPTYSFEFGSWKDFRYGIIPYSGIRTYKICCIPYGAATAVYISWDFPEGVTGLLQDGFGGLLFNYQMPDSGTYTNPYYLQLGVMGINLVLTYQNVIPVELISFNATLLDDNVDLIGQQQQKQITLGLRLNGLRFQLRTGQGWQEIGFVPGFGTTTEPKSYSFIDENITTGIYKYRLKQIDFDGSFEYSNEIEVEVDFTPKEFVLYQNYPNPFNPNTVISYQLPVTGNVTLKVYDILGNEVATLVNEEKQPDIYEVKFDASALASGLYLYKLQAGSFVQTKKMILLK